MKPAALHAKQKTIVAKSAQWLVQPQRGQQLRKDLDELAAYVQAPGPLSGRCGAQMRLLAHHYGIAACDAFGRGDLAGLAAFVRWTVDFRALLVRFAGAYALSHPDEITNTPQEFRTSVHAAGPTMRSDWTQARTCAEFFQTMAGKDARLRPPAGRMLRQPTVDAFLSALFAAGYAMDNAYQPAEPLQPGYRQVLDTWQGDDDAAFGRAMRAAADFHVERSKPGTDRTTYEFEDYFDQVFAVELLAVQALRRRDGRADVTIGHALIDAVWPTLSALPQAEAHPLAIALQQRLLQSEPGFR